jgi:hypothetical protein
MTVHCWVAEAQVLFGGGEEDEEQPVAGDGLVCAEEAVAVGGTGAGCSQFRGSFGGDDPRDRAEHPGNSSISFTCLVKTEIVLTAGARLEK